jgi:replicative DNA helicase
VSAVSSMGPLGNVETEAVLLGTMMQVNQVIDQVADKLAHDDFVEPLHGRIFTAIVREHALGHTVIPPTIKHYFIDDPAMQEVGGVGYLARLTGSGVGAIGVKGFVEQIKELSRRRALEAGLRDAIAKVRDQEIDTDALVADVEATLALTSVEPDRGAKEISAADALGNFLKAIEEGFPPGVSSGIESLDEAMGPIRRGHLQIIAGRPGMGKSVLGMSIARGASQRGHGVLFVSLEMTDDQLVARLAADLSFNGHSGINFTNIESGDLTDEQFKLVYRVKDRIRDLPLTIADLPSLRIGQLNTLIRRQARKFAAKNQQLELVVVDYLQLIDADRQSDSRNAEVTQISRGLKMAAKANGVGIIALAQLSRKVEEREEKRPRLADLRDSGSIEQDADGVLFLYRPEYYLFQAEPPKDHQRREKWEASLNACQGYIEFICAKRRQGQTGIRRGRFYGCYQAVR